MTRTTLPRPFSTRRRVPRYLWSALVLVAMAQGCSAVEPSAVAPPSREPAHPMALPWNRIELPNGLVAYLLPDSSAGEVAVEFWVRGGAREEPPGRHGLAHLFEHSMPRAPSMAEGTPTRQAMDKLRTDSNARTRYDYMRFFKQTRPEGLDLFLVEASERLRADPGAMTAELLERHRENVAREMERFADTRYGPRVQTALHRGVFGDDHPYGHAIYGSLDEVRAATLGDIRRWFRAHVYPEDTVVFVAGRFDPGHAKTVIRRHFGSLPPRGERAVRLRPHIPPASSRSEEIRTPIPSPLWLLAWPVPEWGTREDAALRLLVRVLNERFAEALGAGDPLPVDTPFAEAQFLERAGYFALGAGVADGADTREALAWLRARLAELLASGITEQEVRRAREAERSGLEQTLEQLGWIDSRIELVGEGVLFRGDPDAYLTRLRRQEAATVESVRAVAARWLSASGFALLVRPGESG